MLVRADGSTLGTVGGGQMEADVLRAALETHQSHQAALNEYHFSGKDAADSDSICGGWLQVLIEWWDANDLLQHRIAAALAQTAAANRKAWLVTCLPQAATRDAQRHSLMLADGSLLGDLPEGISAEQVRDCKATSLLHSPGGDVLVDPLTSSGSAYIFGCGHVSQSLAEFTGKVHFWTVVLDDRPEFANRERFPQADEIVLLPSYEKCFAGLDIDRSSFIVIVTRGHLHDQTVLEQALRTPAGYIGMIGSRRKVILILKDLRDKGFSEADIARIRAPIGLPIGGETPEEIGISIVAEMIQERSKLQAA